MGKSLRIAYMDHTGEMGGAEHLLLSLLSQLPPDKVTPILFCGQKGRFFEEACANGIKTIIIELPKFYSTSWVLNNKKIFNPFAVLWNGVSLIFTTLKFVRQIKEYKIDIIQTNTVLSHIYGGLTSRMLKIPCIWYFHDLIEPKRLAGIIAYVWRVLANNIPTQIVADSYAVLHNLASTSPGKVIHPGVTVLDNKRPNNMVPLIQRLGLPPGAVLIGSLGRITYVKGIDVLIEAAKSVIKNHDDVHFVIFGGALFGEAKYKLSLETLVNSQGLSRNWHWMGYDEYAKEYLQELDFVVFPSRREAFGLAVVEAGLSEKAVIATSVGGIPEIIEEGKTGLLISSEDPKELALAMNRLIMDRDYSKILGKNAKLRMLSLFNNTRYRDDFLEFYNCFK